MPDAIAKYQLTISRNEAKDGTERVLTRNGRRLEVTIPAGMKAGSLVKLSGALQITDGIGGDILIHIRIVRDQQRIFKTLGFWSLILCIPGAYGFFSALPNIAFFLSAIVLGIIQFRRHFSKLAVAGFTIGIFSLVWLGVLLGTPESPSHIYAYGIREVGGDGKPIELINNPNAKDPSWDELIMFIQSDPTDSKPYILTFYWGYVCTDYAEDVHNNAEATGIRASWVGIDFADGGPGHALNAFQTTDKGLVFIDCTELDTIAYVKKGKELAYIDLDTDYSPEYSYYEENKQLWPYPPMGVVEDMQIHWGEN